MIRFSFPVLLVIGVYFLGPQPATPLWGEDFPSVPTNAAELTAFIEQKESAHKLKPDNEARIIWFDSTRSKTGYSVVYLHGFSASQEEGDPVHTDFARKFGCNLFLARLADHGIDTTEQLLYFTGDRFWESAKEALAIGNALGDKTILISTSTGGTVALALAAAFPEKVHALINMSPNIEINNPSAFLLNNAWGLHIARLVIGGDYQVIDYPEERLPYWNEKYRLEALTELQEILESKMNMETFQKVKQPTLNIYYYKDEENQDPTVRVDAMLRMHVQLGTPDDLKVAIPIPGAGAHVVGSHLVSKDLPAVQRAIDQFAVEKLGMKSVLSGGS